MRGAVPKSKSKSALNINLNVHPLTSILLSARARLQVKAALCAALYPNAAVMDESGGAGRPAWNDGAADVHIHPSSSLHALEAAAFARPYLVYLEKVPCQAVKRFEWVFEGPIVR